MDGYPQQHYGRPHAHIQSGHSSRNPLGRPNLVLRIPATEQLRQRALKWRWWTASKLKRHGDLPMIRQNSNSNETLPPQDERVSLNFAVGSEVALMCDFQDQESTLSSPRPAKCKSNPTATRSTIYGKTATPSSVSPTSQFNHGHYHN